MSKERIVALERTPRKVTREAVLAALAEYRSVGQQAFLEKYGFRPSRKYRLWFNDESYDSKAILGAAFGYFIYVPPPDVPALTALLQRDSLQIGLQRRTFAFYVPSKINFHSPLLIALHGSMGNAEQMRRASGYRFEELADGKWDHLPEDAFMYVGSIEQAEEQAKKRK